MDPIDRLREARKQTRIARSELKERGDPSGVSGGELRRAATCLEDAIEELETDGGQDAEVRPLPDGETMRARAIGGLFTGTQSGPFDVGLAIHPSLEPDDPFLWFDITGPMGEIGLTLRPGQAREIADAIDGAAEVCEDG